MQISLEIIIHISIWSIIGVILLFYILFPLKKIKSIEKTIALYRILSIDELNKRLKHLMEVESELPPEVYSYSSGWKKEPPLMYHLQELDNQFFSFDRKKGWYYHLKGKLRIIQEDKSNKLFVTFDQSFLFNLYLVIIIGFFVIFFVIPFFTKMSSIFLYFYYFLGPLLCMLFYIITNHSINRLINTDEENFLESIKDKLLS